MLHIIFKYAVLCTFNRNGLQTSGEFVTSIPHFARCCSSLYSPTSGQLHCQISEEIVSCLCTLFVNVRLHIIASRWPHAHKSHTVKTSLGWQRSGLGLSRNGRVRTLISDQKQLETYNSHTIYHLPSSSAWWAWWLFADLHFSKRLILVAASK